VQREGENQEYVHIVKEGLFQVNKFLYIPRSSEIEY